MEIYDCLRINAQSCLKIKIKFDYKEQVLISLSPPHLYCIFFILLINKINRRINIFVVGEYTRNIFLAENLKKEKGRNEISAKSSLCVKWNKKGMKWRTMCVKREQKYIVWFFYKNIPSL